MPIHIGIRCSGCGRVHFVSALKRIGMSGASGELKGVIAGGNEALVTVTTVKRPSKALFSRNYCGRE